MRGSQENRLAHVQGLRAIAVALVVVFHIWPSILPGGYVGVDTFFVISGFLVTRMLVREIEATGQIDVASFVLRRLRRLSPVALVSLAFIAFLTPVFIPEALWIDTLRELAASAIYLENWYLYHLSVDYLGAENAPSPVQHFWSLSIEVQLYVIWALAFFGIASVASTAMPARSISTGAILAASSASLLASAVLTNIAPDGAYFSTITRLWEFGLGGMIAVIGPKAITAACRSTILSNMYVALGLLLIGYSAARYTLETSYPGLWALLPTVGTMLVIVFGNQEKGKLQIAGILNLRPVTYLGDISYSIYIVHWPIIVFVRHQNGPDIGVGEGIVIILLTLAIAALLKMFVEDFYAVNVKRRTHRRVVVADLAHPLLAVIAVFSSLAVAGGSYSNDIRHHPGALAMVTPAISPIEAAPPPIPAPSLVKLDREEAYDSGCHLDGTEIALNPCEYGERSAKYHVLVVGDSHSVNWIPALREIADRRGWRLTTQTKASCAILLQPIMMRGSRIYESCLEWVPLVMETITTDPPDLVIWSKSTTTRLAAFSNQSAASDAAMEAAFLEVWSDILATGTTLVAIAEIPRMPFDLTECLSDGEQCFITFNERLYDDPTLRAQRQMPEIGLINMNDILCDALICPAIIGNVVVWRDTHHITATYSRSAASIFEDRLLGELERLAAPFPP